MKEATVTLKVHVQPRASKDGIEGLWGDALKVKLNAPPLEGKANKALMRFLAERFGLAPSQVEIIAGRRSRNKLLRITGISREALERILGIGLPPL